MAVSHLVCTHSTQASIHKFNMVHCAQKRGPAVPSTLLPKASAMLLLPAYPYQALQAAYYAAHWYTWYSANLVHVQWSPRMQQALKTKVQVSVDTHNVSKEASMPHDS